MTSEGSMGDTAAADFTFCQVSSSEEGVLESPKVIPQVGNIRITEDTPGSGHNATTTTDSNLNEIHGENSAEIAVGLTSLNETANKKKPESRKKVPFEKGFSQMDWLKVTRTHPDLAGLKGQTNRRAISLDEVKQHKSDGSVWTVLKGRVYNITPYMKFHPGGVDMLMKAAGRDCTPLFYKYHAWVNAEFLLEKCLVGILDDGM